MPAANERFHASGGVCPQTVLCGFGSLSPARTFVEPPPSPSRHPVMRQQRTAKCVLQARKKNINQTK